MAQAFAITLFGKPLLLRGEWSADLLAHEHKHAEQQKRWYYVPWYLFYLLWPPFRFRQEVEAYRVSVQHGMSLEAAADQLTKWYYFLFTSKQKVTDALLVG